ncbi:hypothetical protein [Pseudonocardia parietis]|uniref:Peptidoglycan/xylan/chitin deacetylase (PgdA/CDA1 family) n=1 Tax=Pseudonocardia parietis TaxID=570936 RepID=A0ABS4W215_9PSEU|nr:hypothetical protein [Pseudonocardia parietis]MBP2370252.1 peptidoglycan/xylan/chitin deacetylase (PgdA/CDA1 family) [Pseudonocardia parietis]
MNGPREYPATVDELPEIDRAAIGPRVPGGRYRSGYWGVTYRVDAVLVGHAARKEIPWSDLAIVETDLDGPNAGQRRVHCTAWNGKRDRPLDPRQYRARVARLGMAGRSTA